MNRTKLTTSLATAIALSLTLTGVASASAAPASALPASVTTATSNVFGPDGTHYPSDTPDLRGNTAGYHIVEVAATGTAIRNALNNLTPAQIDQGAIIKVAPGNLSNIDAINGYKNTRDNKILITARDGYESVTSDETWTFENIEGLSFLRFNARALDVRGAVHSSFGWMTLSYNYLGAVSPSATSPVDDLEFIEVVEPNSVVKSSDSGQTKAYAGKVVKDVVYEGSYFAPSYYVDAVYNTPTTPDRPHTDTLQIEGAGIEAPGIRITDTVFFGSNNTAVIIGGVANINFDHSLIVGAGKQTLRYPYMVGGAGYAGAINGPGSLSAIQGTGGGNIDANDSIFIGSLAPKWDTVSNTRINVTGKTATTGSFTVDPSLVSWTTTDLDAVSPAPTPAYLASIWNVSSTADTVAPTVSLTPPTGSVNATATLTAAASDNVGVTGVSYYVGGNKVSDATKNTTGAWIGTIDTTNYSNGTYAVTAEAIDAAGNTTVSAAVNLVVNHPVAADTIAPNVLITSPVAGTTVNNTVTLTASATDNVAVTKVTYYAAGTKVGDAVKNASGIWVSTVDTTAYPAGTYAVTAKAEDAAGNITTSAAISLTVSHTVTPPAPDTTAPVVSISSPTSGTTVGNSATLIAAASDNVAVTSVSFWSGTTKIGDAVKQTNGSWKLVASTASYPEGTYPITAKAEDAAGNTKTSTVINLIVNR